MKSESGKMIRLNKVRNVAGKDFGLTDTLNTSTVEKPIEALICEMTDGGVDFSFDCTGNPDIISAAMQCCRPVSPLSISSPVHASLVQFMVSHPNIRGRI